MVNGDWLPIQFFLHAQMGLFQLTILTDHLSASYKLWSLLLHSSFTYLNVICFSLWFMQHHCRSCGRTLCHEHSSNQLVCLFYSNFIYLCSNFSNWWTFIEQSWFCLQTQALPQFGIYSTVRVCSDCFNDSSR